MSRWSMTLGLFAGLNLWACETKDEGITEESDTDTDADTDTDTDTDADTDTDTDITSFEPVAVGVTMWGGYRHPLDLGGAGELLPYAYSGDTSINYPLLIIGIADIEFFSLGADDPDKDKHLCELFASFPHEVDATPPKGYFFDYDAGYGGTGDSTSLYFFAEGYADVYGYSYKTDENGDPLYDENDILVPSAACSFLIEDGTYDLFNGMHVGVGIGGMSDYIVENVFANFKDKNADLLGKVDGAYIAINHPSKTAADGYDFLAYDWGYTYFFEGELFENVEVTDAKGKVSYLDLISVAVNKSDSTLIFTETEQTAHVRAYSFWYEDFPNLDLTLLKEGIPEGLSR